MESDEVAKKVFEALAPVVEEKGGSLNQSTLLYSTPDAPAPDPKIKDPTAGHNLLGEALGMLEGAVTSVGLDLESDVCFCINVHATSLCTPTEVPPPEVE